MPPVDAELAAAQGTAKKEAEARRRAEIVLKEAQRVAIKLKEENQLLDERLDLARLDARNADHDRDEALSHVDALTREVVDTKAREEEKSVAIASALDQADTLIRGLRKAIPPDSMGGERSPRGKLITSVITRLDDIQATLRGVESKGKTAPAITVQNYPVLSNSAQRTFAHYEQRGGIAMDRLIAMYDAWDADSREEIVSAFWESLGIIRGRSDIDESIDFADLVIEEVINPKTSPQKVRGFAMQTIRTAQLLDAGRRLTAIEAAIKYDIHFNELFIDTKSGWIIRCPTKYKIHMVDALEDKIIIELKAMSFDERVAHVLPLLLRSATEKCSAMEKVFGIHQFNDEDTAQHAVKLANQTARFRLLIDKGVADKLELHATSHQPVHRLMVRAIHDHFEPGTVDIIWYKNLLSKGIFLRPAQLK